ncbi:MAG: hypothetical protein ACM3SM_10970 [Bacteroidota bacterium]
MKNTKYLYTCLLAMFILSAVSVLYAQSKTSAISSRAGAFSRMGFGARGIGLGNAASAITEGSLVSYYNPALPVFQKNNSAILGYSFLSLDRKLNFVSFTRKFEFFSDKDTLKTKPASTAGLSFGVINSGVSKIDGRDNQGFKTEELSTSENQFFFSVSNKFSDKLAIGISIKFFYYKLYTDISSSGIGLDLGALYSFSKNLKMSLMLADLNSKYKWDTSPVYEQQGRNTEDKFPTLKKIGFSYSFDNPAIIAAVELESSNAGTNILRIGTEYRIIDELTVRAGLDKWNLNNSDDKIRPAAGFSLYRSFGSVRMAVDYAFSSDTYSPSDHHIVGLNFIF